MKRFLIFIVALCMLCSTAQAGRYRTKVKYGGVVKAKTFYVPCVGCVTRTKHITWRVAAPVVVAPVVVAPRARVYYQQVPVVQHYELLPPPTLVPAPEQGRVPTPIPGLEDQDIQTE